MKNMKWNRQNKTKSTKKELNQEQEAINKKVIYI